MNFKKILNRLHYWKKRDDKSQKAFDVFIGKVAPSSNSPFLENSNAVIAYIDGVSNGDKELRDWLEYHAYRRQDWGGTFECYDTVDGKKIECEDSGDKKLFAEFLDKIFNQ